MTLAYEVVEAYCRRLDEAVCDIWEKARKASDRNRYPWSTISLTRAKKIWRDYAKLKIVRDERGLNDIADEVVDKIVKIDAMTILSGHTPQNPKEVLKDLEIEWDQETDDRMSSFLEDENGRWRISDYGLKPLQELAGQILSTTVPEERILLIDKVFNVIHQRSDIASWFIAGGRNALDELSNQEV